MTRLSAVVLFSFICACSFQLLAQEESSMNMQLAAKAYTHGKFAEAISLYEEATVKCKSDASLFYNLGNAYFKNGELGKSILNYERAALLDPGSDDIRHNILVVQSRLRDRVEPIPLLFVVQWWNDIKADNSSHILFLWSLAFLWLFAGSIFVFYGFESILLRRVAMLVGSLFLLLFVATTLLKMDKVEDTDAHRYGIVVDKEHTVHSTPDASGIESYLVHEGLKVEILIRRDSWYRIRLADGKDGWLPSKSVERI